MLVDFPCKFGAVLFAVDDVALTSACLCRTVTVVRVSCVVFVNVDGCDVFAVGFKFGIVREWACLNFGTVAVGKCSAVHFVSPCVGVFCFLYAEYITVI